MDFESPSPMDLEGTTVYNPDNDTNNNVSEWGNNVSSIPDCVGNGSESCSEVDLADSLLTGTALAVSEWEVIVGGIFLSLIVLITLVGNTLVILSVFTYRPLRITPNFFIVSLAMTDITVALVVFPFSVPYCLTGRWSFGVAMCQIWLTLNVLCCSASILHLCAIALDRYWAIKNPIAYAKKRTLRRVLVIIGCIWTLSVGLSSILLVGGKESAERFSKLTTCSLKSYANFVVSVVIAIFYFALLIMTAIYARIFVTVRRRLRDGVRSSVLDVATRCPDCPVTEDTISGSHSEGWELKNLDRRGTVRKEGVPVGNNTISYELNGKPPPASSNDNVLSMGIGIANEEVPSSKTLRQSSRGSESDDSFQGSSGENRVREAEVKVEEGNVNDPRRTLGATYTTGEDRVKEMLSNPGTLNAVHQLVEERQRISLSKERRLARTLGFIMGVFVVCWLPFFIMYLIIPFCSSCRPSQKVANFITWLGYMNSTLNPIIFTIFNLEFRRAFKKLLHIKS